MKNKLTFTALLACCLMLAVAFASVTYAWIFTGDVARGMEYSIAKIDSTVSLYRAIDDNKNGVPNRLSESEQLKYYVEQYEFEKLGEDKFALTDDTEANLLTTVVLDNVVPTETYTLKYALVNKSTAENLITFKFYATEIEHIDLLSTLSMRLGIVKSDAVDSTATVEFGEKMYLADHISGGVVEETEIEALSSDIYIAGMSGAETPDNFCDFWLQIEMESYEALVTHTGFTLTEEEYNALQGQSVSLPYLYVYFEVVIDEAENIAHQ